MNRPISYVGSANKTLDRVMNPEQFTQVIEAILNGKYSWACVLILRFAGYNPLHYIPYRTYNRLVKDNNLVKQFDENSSKNDIQKQLKESTGCAFPTITSQELEPHSIQDLAYLEPSEDPTSKIFGGWCSWFVG
jgi:hypothetical protein